jgi:hypothetical protein
MQKRRYSEMGTTGKALVLLITAISLLIIGRAERDISSREDEEVRGSRTVWRLVSLNAVGALAYLRFGRR